MSTWAQSSTDPLRIGSVTVSGSIRTRGEAWSWFSTKGAEDTYGFSGSLLRLSLSQQHDAFDWTVEFAAPILLGLPDHAIAPAPQGQLGQGASYYAANQNQQYAGMVFAKQAFLRLKGEHSSLRLGRFQFNDGSEAVPKDATLAALKRDRISQRLIGAFGFTHVERSLDGAQYVYSNGSWNLTAMAVIPTRGVFQVDGWGWVKTPFVYTALTRQVSFGKSNADWRVFGIYYDDDRGVLKSDNRPAAMLRQDLRAIRIGTFGGHYIQAIPTRAGTFDLLGWGVLQAGNWGALKHRAAAGAVEAGFQPQIARSLRPWLRGGYFYGSGDKNPSDNTHGTFFALLPTPRIYARFPFFNEMNNRDLFAELILRPHKNLTLRTDAHGLSLASRNDLWYLGGGAFQPWTFGYSGRPSGGKTSLAKLYDVSADYQWTRAVSLGLYFGYAHGGDVMKNIYPMARMVRMALWK